VTSVPRPLLVCVAAAGLVLLGSLGWLAKDLAPQAGSSGGRPSLFELLEEMRGAPAGPEPGRRAAPAPPPPPPPRALQPTQPGNPPCAPAAR
jgi:hypothetical protein